VDSLPAGSASLEQTRLWTFPLETIAARSDGRAAAIQRAAVQELATMQITMAARDGAFGGRSEVRPLFAGRLRDFRGDLEGDRGAKAAYLLARPSSARIRDLLRRYLSQEGFDVLLAEDSKALNRMLTRETVDLIVLDLMLPGEDGLSICRRLRAANDVTPIIMLTAKVEDVDRIVGLEVGADDYLPKPFNPRELLARIHAVLRRRPAQEAPGAPSKEQQIVNFGPFEFDLSLRKLSKNGEQIALTTGEFSMLKALVRHPRQPLSRDKLAQLARGREFEPFDRSLDVQISRLRKMLEPDPAQPRYIQTVWGVGYVFVPDGSN
jgi:two-component system phosphate regulon response regulator OmpR